MLKTVENSSMLFLFVAHGVPILLDGPQWMSELAHWSFPITGWWMNSAFNKRSVQHD
jgi:hypothetical protein